ncbi:MAG: hypothetical protein CO070_08810 [Gallionellales bacterium CG_4_9_14_0_8_um_filter_55_61]|nr:MAG: hypothetical protein CO070_08810 [Gallionellales bacterium CG_4_9_14_0_8_um_filter_55_61]
MNAARGWIWVKQGYQLIMRNPLLSISIALLGSLAMLLILKVAPIGSFIAMLLMPIVITGYMRVCRALEEDEAIQFSHLLAGFKKHPARLVSLGGLLILGVVISALTMLLIGGTALGTLLTTLKSIPNQQMLANAMQAAGPGVSFSLLAGFSLMFVLMLAFQYAPMLVYFNDLPPLAAMRASLVGTLRNFIPYTVYSIIMQVLALLLGMLPYSIGLIALLPLGFTSLYVSYRNIFPFKDEIHLIKPATPNPTA